MDLIEKTTAAAPASSTLTPRPSRAWSIKSTMMGLLHKLVQKVSKVLKNEKTLASNQRQLVAYYNADHLDHPILLGSVNGSDSTDEPEGEEAFDAPTPQFQEDPHSEDEEITVAAGGAAGGGDSVVANTIRDDEDDDDDEESSESDGAKGVVASESNSNSK